MPCPGPTMGMNPTGMNERRSSAGNSHAIHFCARFRFNPFTVSEYCVLQTAKSNTASDAEDGRYAGQTTPV